MIFEHVLTDQQIDLAGRLLPHFSKFYLAGGTALALLIGHRRSLDFDLAMAAPVSPFHIEREIRYQGFSIQRTLTATTDEFTVLIEGVKITFFAYPFAVAHGISWARGGICLPDVGELAAMKAYALGRRNKWKDYVDLYFILKSHLDMEKLIDKARAIFADHFNARLFREKLCFFEDIDYTEGVEYLAEAPSVEDIRIFLTKEAIRI